MGSNNFLIQKSSPLSKNDLKLVSNIPKYLEQICDAQNSILEQQSSINEYLKNKELQISNDTNRIERVKSSIDSNLIILNELKQLSIAINNDVKKLWKAFKNDDESTLKTTYNIIKPTIKIYNQYIDNNKSTQIRNNTTIHSFLKEAKKQQKVYNLELQKSKRKKIYQSKLLIITEKKIYLPYNNEDIQKLINKNNQNQVDEIIKNRFVITNVKPFKSSSSHRFTQAYKLSKTKSKKTIFEALKFALKVARIGNLHPAIIHACSSEDQLENYIMFLNQGNPSAFTDFDVKFQINPI